MKLAAQERERAQRLSPEPEKVNRKYHNTPETRQASESEIRFDSKAEARHYDKLMLLLQVNKISDLKLQPQFTLQESYITPEGKRVQAIKYVADFSFKDENGELHVQDVKSKATKTRVYKIKAKLMQERFGINIEEIEKEESL